MGVVEKTGPGASKFEQGQRVVAAGWPSGTWQQFIVQSEAKLVRVPLCGCFLESDPKGLLQAALLARPLAAASVCRLRDGGVIAGSAAVAEVDRRQRTQHCLQASRAGKIKSNQTINISNRFIAAVGTG